MPLADLPTVFDSWPQLAAAAAVLAVAQAVYVLLGFGAGLIAVGGLALILPEVRDAVVVLMLVNLPAELWVVATSWRRVVWSGVAWVLGGIAVGIPAGAALLSWGEPVLLLTALGGLLVAVGAIFLVLPPGGAVAWPGWSRPLVGALSGVLTGLFGTGGPPLIVYYQLQGLDKSAFRGTLMTLFLAMTAIRVPSYVAVGLVTPARLWSGLAVLPAVVLGAVLGHHLHLRLSERSFRRLVSLALVAIGLLLVLR